MRRLRRPLVIIGLCSCLCTAASGCETIWHNLQPHRLHQLNRGPGMTPGAEAYSVLEAPVLPVG